MQVNKISANIPIQENNNQSQYKKRQNTSFKGVDSFCLGVANAVENGGLAVSFTMQDMAGTNFPRFLSGLFRNSSENNGEINVNFAMKEGVREFLTGPSMFLIPMGILAVAKKALGSAILIPSRVIKEFNNIHAQNAETYTKDTAKQTFFKNTFTQIIKNAKGEETVSKSTLQEAEKFAQNLENGINSKEKNGLKNTIVSMTDDFINISKSHAKEAAYTDYTVAKLSDGVKAPFKTMVSNMMDYADDLVKNTADKTPVRFKKYIGDLANEKIIKRFSLNLLMYSSVLTFLQVIPKLYNSAEGKGNAGLKGLMAKETFDDKELNENEKAVKSNASPSFGSKSSIAKHITGSGKIGKFSDSMEFEGFNMSFNQLLGLMGIGILYPRIKNAKDDYDKEEIIRRDLVTCATMCFAEKALRKAFSKLNEAKSGLVLALKGKDFSDKKWYQKAFDYIRPLKGVNVLSTDQIRAYYTNIDKYKDGIKGFCDFVTGQNGKLSKVFGLTKESKAIVNNLLKSEGKNIETADNKTITSVLDKSKNSKEVKELIDLFKDKDNPWVKQARTLNARFTTLSIVVLVPVFLGFMLPAINEHYTKKRISSEQADKNASNTANSANKFDFMKKIKTNSVFSDMNKK